MNIIFFHINGISKTKGGVSKTTDTLCRVFRDNGHRVWCVGEKNIEVDIVFDEWQLFLPDAELISSPTNITFLCDFVKEQQIDVIINQASQTDRTVTFLAQIKERTGVRFFSCIHNSILTPVYNGAYQKEYLLKKRRLGFVFDLMRQPMVNRLMVAAYIKRNRYRYLRLLKESDNVVVLCDGQREELLKMCGTRDDSKVVVVPNIQEPAVDKSHELEKKHTVLWVGTFDYSIKRPDYMLKIWRKVMNNHLDWSLILLGDGPSFNEMKELSQQMKLKNVTFEGRVNPQEFYKSASIVCITSVHESFSLVATEAHSNGVVPVSFDSFTAARMVIDDGKDGVLVKPFNLDEYASALSKLMDESSRREEMSQAARQGIEKFSPRVIYDIWNHLLR